MNFATCKIFKNVKLPFIFSPKNYEVPALQMFTGYPQVFPAISMEEGCKNHREIMYSLKGKIVFSVGGKPVIFTDCGENPMKTKGFPRNL